jgi:nucleoside triphosphate pyrophosphatase
MSCDDSGIRRLILASGSPRRRQLLSLLGLPFVIKAVGMDETAMPGEPPTELVLRVGQAKALATSSVRPDELVVAADTIVALDGEALGKPADAEEARQMLWRLRGRAHIVYSGVAVWQPARRRMVTELSESVVWMRDYSQAEIDAYVETGDPLDKAGAYAIQHPEFDPVSRVEGCWLNVMGLPLCHLQRALARFGVRVPPNVPGTCKAFNQRECSVYADIITPVR